MVKRILPLFYVLLVLIVLASCEEKSSPTLDEQNFTKIYDNNQFSVDYFPIDVQQTDDGGYLILGERRLYDSTYRLTYLVKVDKYGNFEKDLEVDEQFVNPVGRLAKFQGSYYFFCMDGNNTDAYLASVDEDLAGIQTVRAGSLYYPAASSYYIENEGFVLLSYDDLAKTSVLSVIDITGASVRSKAFSIGIGEDIEEPIINHFIHAGKQLPFSAGKTPGGLYYFNGFYNYTLAFAFTDLAGTDDDEESVPNGVINGQQDNGGISAAFPITATKFAFARFNFGDNYLVPNAAVESSAINSAVDLKGNKLPELMADARVRVTRIITEDLAKNVILYAGDTRTRQIGLYFYDEATGEFISSRYLGFANPFEISNVIQTADGGIAVCGTTYLAGRFPRICLFKISQAELAKNTKMKE